MDLTLVATWLFVANLAVSVVWAGVAIALADRENIVASVACMCASAVGASGCFALHLLLPPKDRVASP